MWKDAKIIYDKINSIPPVSEIPDGLTEDLYPYYLDKPYLNEYGSIVGGGNTSHDYVEIGGIKWATMNLGAKSITDYGKYYAWGDTQGYTADQVGTDKDFSGQDYVYGPIDWQASPDYGITKYNNQDGLTTLQSGDDAVTAEWGGSWRMPTTTEWQALDAAVNTAWTSDYKGSGIAGLVCTEKNDSSKVLFFPAAGGCGDGSVNGVGDYGCYWSSSGGGIGVGDAYLVNFDNEEAYWDDYGSRISGNSIRGVLDE